MARARLSTRVASTRMVKFGLALGWYAHRDGGATCDGHCRAACAAQIEIAACTRCAASGLCECIAWARIRKRVLASGNERGGHGELYERIRWVGCVTVSVTAHCSLCVLLIIKAKLGRCYVEARGHEILRSVGRASSFRWVT